MSIEPQAPAKSLTQMVATQIKLQMVLADDIKQSQLARKIGKTEQWLSVRLRGVQPIDLNDLLLIAQGLGVGVHDLLPSPEAAAEATAPPPATSIRLRGRGAREPNERSRPGGPTGRRADGAGHRNALGGTGHLVGAVSPFSPQRSGSTGPDSSVPPNKRRPSLVRPGVQRTPLR